MKTNGRYLSLLVGLLPLLSGFLLALALPPRNWNVLGWIAFVPLLAASKSSSSALTAFGSGILASFVCASVLAGRWDPLFVILIAPFGALGLALGFVACFASLSHKRLSPSNWVIAVACAGVTAEYLAAFLFPVNVAFSQHQNATALRLASYTGIWGVTFFIWIVSASVLLLLDKPRVRWHVILVILVLLAAVSFAPFNSETGGRVIHAAAVQAQVPLHASEETDKLAPDVKLVVWPELLMEPNDPTPFEAAKKNHVFLVASFLERRPGKKPCNTAYLISPDGKKMAVSYKQHLFGPENREYIRGRRLPPADAGGFKPGMPICFDTFFTDVTRRLVRQGADILLVPNLDPHVPGSLLNYLHTAVVPFRAAENGVPIVWAECSGLSAIYNSHGQRIARASVDATTSVKSLVQLRTRRTFYNTAGDYFAYLCAVMCEIIYFGILSPLSTQHCL